MVVLITILTILATVQNVYAAVWSEGAIYKITPVDNMVTAKDYTIKTIDFPAPIRGVRTITGSIVPDRPIVPFVAFELYKDIINNTNPIGQFSLGVGDEYITPDGEIRVVLHNIPGEMSQDWVYEYYNPWADIKIQKRGLPNIGVEINIDIDDGAIDPGDKFKMIVKVRNTGEDIIKNIELQVKDPSLMMMPSKYVRTIDHLDKDEEEDMSTITLESPKIIEEREYEIYANVTGYDIKNIKYSYSSSRKIKVRDAFQLLKFNKGITKDSVYLKEYETVVLSITNYGNIYMSNVQIYDRLLNQTIRIGNENITELFLNSSSIAPGEPWSFSYMVKPLEPGIYVLPRFKSTFSMLGQDFEAVSSEAGFRVFGPRILVDKVVKRNEEDNDLIEVYVTVKNNGNGFAKIVIDDDLPEESRLISGRLNLTTSLGTGQEKVMNYTAKIPWDIVNMSESKSGNINISSWPPAKVTYYLDDYVFTTFSNETYMPYDQLVWTIESKGAKEELEIIKKIKKIEKEKEEKEEEKGNIVPIATLSGTNETQKRVVATIPIKKSDTQENQEKNVPGFGLYEIMMMVMILMLLGRIKIKCEYIKNKRRMYKKQKVKRNEK